MSTSARLRRDLDELVRLARVDLDRLWRLATTESLDALHDLLPPLINTYGLASSAVAAEWYDEARQARQVPGRFRALAADIPNSGTHALVGWATSTAVDDAGLRGLLEGGTQRRILNFGRQTIMQSSVADPQARYWQRVGSGSECDFCQMLIGRGAVYGADTVDFEAHDNCFPAGVLVTSPSVEVGFRRWYEGELIVIGMADGSELPVTPNHPILTPRGWVLAGELHEGDDLIKRAGSDLASLGVPHEQDVPAPIEDVWRAASVYGLRSVPVAPEDFHGDVGSRKGNVDVVSTNGFLQGVLDALAVEHGPQGLHSRAWAPPVLDALTSRCDPLLNLVWNNAAASRLVGRSDQGSPLLTGHAGQPDAVRLGRRPARQTRLFHPPVHHGAGHAVPVGHGEDAFASVIARHQVIGGGDPVVSDDVGVAGPRFHAPALERQANGFRISAEAGRDLLERLSGGVTTSRVVNLSRRELAGHVYNLQTVEGWYSANGLIVSNCRCGAEPVWQPGERERKGLA